jgi:hypothetical protein
MFWHRNSYEKRYISKTAGLEIESQAGTEPKFNYGWRGLTGAFFDFGCQIVVFSFL